MSSLNLKVLNKFARQVCGMHGRTPWKDYIELREREGYALYSIRGDMESLVDIALKEAKKEASANEKYA